MPRGHRARFVAQLIVVVLAAALAALLVESVLPVRARRRALTSASSESYESANATTFTRTWVDGGRAGPYRLDVGQELRMLSESMSVVSFAPSFNRLLAK